MNPAQVISEAQAAGVVIAVRDGGIVLKWPRATVAQFVEPLRAAKPAIIAILSRRPQDICTAAAITPASSAPAEWVAGVASLSISDCPFTIPADKWQTLTQTADRFIAAPWAGRLSALGWRTIDIFGADPLAPAERHDHKGLIWFLPGHRLIAATADTATIETPAGSRQTYYRQNNRVTDMVLLWDLPSKGRDSP